MLLRADLNETSPVCLFPTPKETITEVKIRIGGGRKIEIFGSGGAIDYWQYCEALLSGHKYVSEAI